MKEIFVRLWDKQDREMIPGMQLWMFVGWVSAKYSLGTDLTRFEAMEWTGFFDPEKKRIYEGDVIAYDRKSKDGKRVLETHLWEVVWDDKKGMWKCRRMDGSSSEKGTLSRLAEKVINHRVVGNIYE